MGLQQLLITSGPSSKWSGQREMGGKSTRSNPYEYRQVSEARKPPSSAKVQEALQNHLEFSSDLDTAYTPGVEPQAAGGWGRKRGEPLCCKRGSPAMLAIHRPNSSLPAASDLVLDSS